MPRRILQQTVTPSTRRVIKSAPPKKRGVFGTLGQVGVGAGKGALSTARGASSLGERTIKGIGRVLAPKKFERKLGFQSPVKTSAEQLISKELTKPKNTAQKVGFVLEQIAEFAVPTGAAAQATKAAKVGFGTKAATQAVVSGATAATQEGKVGSEAAVAATLGGGFSLAGSGLGKMLSKGRMVKKATGLTPTALRNADDIVKTKIGVGGKVAKAYDDVDDFLIKEGFFKKGLKSTRDDMVEHAQNVLKGAKSSKKDVLSKIVAKVPRKKVPKFKELVNKLIEENKNVLGRESAFKRLNEIAHKKTLTAIDIDDVRKMADDFMFSTSKTESAAGIREVLKPIRKMLGKLDTTGTIQRDNIKIRAMSELLGIGKKSNPLATAAQRDPSFSIMSRLLGGAGAGATAGLLGVPGVAPIAAGIGALEATTSSPAIASAIVKQLSKEGIKTTPKVIMDLLRAASVKGGSSL